MNHHETTRETPYRGPDEAVYRGYSMRRRSDLMSAMTDAVRENPMSAALIGLGALWLFTGGNRMSLLGGSGRSSLIGTAAHGASDMAQGTAHAASRLGSDMASAVSSTVGGFAEAVGDTASRVGDYVSSSMHGVNAEAAYRNRAVADDMESDRYSGEDESPRDRMPSPSDMRSGLQDMLERHPVALGLAGLVIGAGVAASLPLTRTERDTLGRAGEALRSTVSEAAGHAKEVAAAMADEVTQQASAAGSPHLSDPRGSAL